MEKDGLQERDISLFHQSVISQLFESGYNLDELRVYQDPAPLIRISCLCIVPYSKVPSTASYLSSTKIHHQSILSNPRQVGQKEQYYGFANFSGQHGL